MSKCIESGQEIAYEYSEALESLQGGAK